jgi:hypothetical protein
MHFDEDERVIRKAYDTSNREQNNKLCFLRVSYLKTIYYTRI